MLSAQEFIDKIITGDNVKNQQIDGFVLLENCEIKQMDWSGCTFNSSVEITNCTLQIKTTSKIEKPGSNEGNVYISEVSYESINLVSTKIEGRLIINDCKFNSDLEGIHKVTFDFNHLTISRDLKLTNLININRDTSDALILADIILDASTIATGLHVNNSRELRSISIKAYRAAFSGSFEFIGNLEEVNLESANIIGDVHLELDTFKNVSDYFKNVSSIFLQRTTISGSFSCMSSQSRSLYYQSILEKMNEEENENGIDIPQILVGHLDLYRARIGRDFFLGSYKEEQCKNYINSIACNSLSLAGCIVSNDIIIDEIEFMGTHILEQYDDQITLNLSNINTNSLTISRVKFEPNYDINSMIFCSISDSKIINEIDFFHWIIKKPISLRLISIDASNLTSKLLKIKNVQIENEDSIDGEFDNILSNIHPIFILNSASIDLLNIKQTSSNSISDASIGAWKFDPPNETADNYINMLNLCVLEELDLKQCVKIEQHLDNIGKRTEADKIHLFWRHREQQKFRSQNEHFKFIVSLFWEKSIQFGLSPLRPLYLLFSTILLSSILFVMNYNSWVQISSDTLSTLNQCGEDCKQLKGELIFDSLGKNHKKFKDGKNEIIIDNKNRIINSILITVSSSTPIIDIGAVKHLEPKPKSGGYWLVMLLKIMGWIVWPLFLTAFVPMILPKKA